jgi:hypothetical protein
VRRKNAERRECRGRDILKRRGREGQYISIPGVPAREYRIANEPFLLLRSGPIVVGENYEHCAAVMRPSPPTADPPVLAMPLPLSLPAADLSRGDGLAQI